MAAPECASSVTGPCAAWVSMPRCSRTPRMRQQVSLLLCHALDIASAPGVNRRAESRPARASFDVDAVEARPGQPCLTGEASATHLCEPTRGSSARANPNQEVQLYESRRKSNASVLPDGPLPDCLTLGLAQASLLLQNFLLKWPFRSLRELRRRCQRNFLINTLFVSLLTLHPLRQSRLATFHLSSVVRYDSYA